MIFLFNFHFIGQKGWKICNFFFFILFFICNFFFNLCNPFCAGEGFDGPFFFLTLRCVLLRHEKGPRCSRHWQQYIKMLYLFINYLSKEVKKTENELVNLYIYFVMFVSPFCDCLCDKKKILLIFKVK